MRITKMNAYILRQRSSLWFSVLFNFTYFTFSQLADAFIQTKIKSYNYKYYIYTFKKIEKLKENDKCIQQHFKTKHLNKNKNVKYTSFLHSKNWLYKLKQKWNN